MEAKQKYHSELTGIRGRSFLFCLIIFAIIFCSKVAEANKTTKITSKSPIQATLVMDARTGKVLHAQNSQLKIYPASLTKLMTLYLLFDAIESGKLSLDSKLSISLKAAKMPPCKLGLTENSTITVKEAILALIIKSANDVAVVVAENISGSEKSFAHLMNLKAKKLGMSSTYFKNASGWHDPLQKTTTRDMAKLGMALKKRHSKFYPLFSKNSFVFRGTLIKGHNRVTQNYVGAEGLKTGYTSSAGFNLVTTASKNKKSLIAVVTGRKTASSRDQQMMALLDKYLKTTPSDTKLTYKAQSKIKNKSYKKNKKKIIRS